MKSKRLLLVKWIKQHRKIIGVSLVILIISIALIIVGYMNGTGFNSYTIITTSKTISATASPTTTTTTVYQPGKTLWDLLQLLIIPAVIAVAGFVINLTISRGEQEATKQRALSERDAAEKRAATEREITLDNQREAALQTYINEMSELLLHENLRESDTQKEVRKIARVRTLTVLPRLDSKRKGNVLRFLHESGLIKINKPVIDMGDADLSGADLREAKLGTILLCQANLSGADLSNAFLRKAYLFGTDLSQANLIRANLYEADLTNADLSGANLCDVDLANADLRGAIVTFEQLDQAYSLRGAFMDDGSIHD